MSFKAIFKKHRKYLVFIAALVTPGGFVLLGALKGYELYKKKQIEKAQKPKTIEEYIQRLTEEAEKNPE